MESINEHIQTVEHQTFRDRVVARWVTQCLAKTDVGHLGVSPHRTMSWLDKVRLGGERAAVEQEIDHAVLSELQAQGVEAAMVYRVWGDTGSGQQTKGTYLHLYDSEQPLHIPFGVVDNVFNHINKEAELRDGEITIYDRGVQIV